MKEKKLKKGFNFQDKTTNKLSLTVSSNLLQLALWKIEIVKRNLNLKSRFFCREKTGKLIKKMIVSDWMRWLLWVSDSTFEKGQDLRSHFRDLDIGSNISSLAFRVWVPWSHHWNVSLALSLGSYQKSLVLGSTFRICPC